MRVTICGAELALERGILTERSTGDDGESLEVFASTADWLCRSVGDTRVGNGGNPKAARSASVVEPGWFMLNPAQPPRTAVKEAADIKILTPVVDFLEVLRLDDLLFFNITLYSLFFRYDTDF